MSGEIKSELEILQEKEHRIQQEIESIEGRLQPLKRISNLLCLVEKCGSYIQDPNHNEIIYFEAELRANKAQLNDVKEKIIQIKSTLTNNTANPVTQTQTTSHDNTRFSFQEWIVIIVIGLLCLWGLYSYFLGSAVSLKYDENSQLYGFTGRLGFTAISPMYEDIAENDSFSDNVRWMKKDGKWGAINKRNKVVVPFEYESENSSLKIEELNELTRNGKHGLIVEDGEILIPFEYDEGFRFDDNNISLAVKDGKVGAINTENEIIIPFVYESLQINGKDFFVEIQFIFNDLEIAMLKKNGKIGIIDKQNNVLVPFMYDDVADDSYWGLRHCLKNDIAILKKDGKVGAVNMTNEVLVPFEYDLVSFELFNDDRFSAKKDNKLYEIDLNGNVYDLYIVD